MNTNFEQIVDVSNIGQRGKVDLNPIATLAEKERFSPATKDSMRRLLLCIDMQKDFIEGGSLEVPSSISDVERVTRFIYTNMSGITKIMCSLDTHIMQQIFHPCWWANEAGDHPEPYTPITYDDVKANRWRAIIDDPKRSINYLKGLESTSKKNLCIWPYHCIEGTDGHSLENEFAKMVYFHSLVRKTRNPMISKGDDPLSEMYGIIKPEYDEKNFMNRPVLNAIEKFDEIYVVGEAASHCVMESVKQIAEHFANRPEVTEKITVFEDCTSPIKGFEDDTKMAFDDFKSNYGIKIAKSTDIQF